MNSQIPNPSTTISMTISEAVYHAVIGVERLVRYCGKALR